MTVIIKSKIAEILSKKDDMFKSGLSQNASMADNAREANQIIRKRKKESLVQGVGLAIFMFGIAAAALTLSFSDENSRVLYLVMFFTACAGIWLAAYRFRYLAVVISGLQMLIYTIYQLYEAIANGRMITALDYMWLFLPPLCVGAMIMFMMNMYKVDKMAEYLEERLQSLEVIEPVTGLNNLRSMYMDLERQMAYASRNNIELTLVIFELRYYQEIKGILNANQFDELKRRMGRLVEDSLRIEDRVYAIDDKGSLGLVCIGCGREGALVVKKRVTDLLSKKESFEGLLDRTLRVDLRVGFYTYDREEIRNAIEFKQKAENELQYDV